MDLETTSDFYNICDPLHREFYSTLLWEWERLGHQLRLSAHGMVLCVRSSKVVEGQGVALFELLPGHGTAPSTIALSLDDWRNWFGESEAGSFLTELKTIHGLEHKLRDGCFSIINPGHMSGNMQQSLRDLMIRFASRSRDLVAL